MGSGELNSEGDPLINQYSLQRGGEGGENSC